MKRVVDEVKRGRQFHPSWFYWYGFLDSRRGLKLEGLIEESGLQSPCDCFGWGRRNPVEELSRSLRSTTQLIGVCWLWIGWSQKGVPSGLKALVAQGVRGGKSVFRVMRSQYCGAAFGARCELPGMAFPACPQLCTRLVNHPGRCWCSFHQTNPNESWQAMEERLWK